MKHLLSGTQTTHTTLEVDEGYLVDKAIEAFLRKVDLYKGQWINAEGQICEDDDSGPGRPWEQKVGAATALQKKAYKAAQTFRDLYNEACRKEEK